MKEKMRDLEVLDVKKIQGEYDLDRDVVYMLLNTRGCPILTGGKGRKYRILRGNFEEWLRKAKVS